MTSTARVLATPPGRAEPTPSLRVLLTPGDLTLVRFVIDPLWEVMAGLDAIAQPQRHWLHRDLPAALTLPARRAARLLTAVMPTREAPLSVLAQPARESRTSPEARLAAVGETPPAVAAAHLDALLRAYPQSNLRVWTPEELVERVAAALRTFWRAALASRWPRVVEILEEDLQHHAGELAARGLRDTLPELHHGLGLTADRLDVRATHVLASTDREASGLTLVPSVYRWPDLVVQAPPGVTIQYPARGGGRLTAADGDGSARLDRLIGRSRARVLAAVLRPAGTTELSQQLNLAPATVSEHLSVLADARLVRPSRQGRRVVYRPTALALALLRR